MFVPLVGAYSIRPNRTSEKERNMSMITATKNFRKITAKHHINISNNSIAYLTKKFFKDFQVSKNNISYVKLGFDKNKRLLAFAFLRNKPLKSKPVKFSKSGKTNNFRVNAIAVTIMEDINGKYCFDPPRPYWKFSKNTYVLSLNQKLHPTKPDK